MWRVGIAWSPSYVDETSQARLPSLAGRRSGLPAHTPSEAFDDCNNAEGEARQDETAVQASRHLGS